MLCLTVQLHEQISVVLPDGRRGHIEVDRVSRGGIRLAIDLPQDVELTRPTAKASGPRTDVGHRPAASGGLCRAASPADQAERLRALAAVGTRGPVVVSEEGRATS